jgi:hypothetical protein
MSAANDERLQLLNNCVFWDGRVDWFKVFRSNIEGHHRQIGAGYLFDPEFQTVYFEIGLQNCF